MMSSIFQAMPLYAWIIIGGVIVFAVVVLIKMKFFGKSAEQKEHDELDRRFKSTGDEKQLDFFSSLAANTGGKRKSKNMKKRRKYKK